MEDIISRAEALASNEVPVVAAIVSEVGEVISIASNEVEASGCPWFHAEFLAVSRAVNILNRKYLDNASIYITLEPCAFCAAVLEKVRIRNIFFGAYDPKFGAIYHNINLFDHSLIKPNIVGGIQERRCSNMMTKFFEKLRREKSGQIK